VRVLGSFGKKCIVRGRVWGVGGGAGFVLGEHAESSVNEPKRSQFCRFEFSIVSDFECVGWIDIHPVENWVRC
jgi:hypothetical protein